MHPLDDTIAAIASAAGGAARGIVRVSGPGVEKCLAGCFQSEDLVRSDSTPGRNPPLPFPTSPQIFRGWAILPEIGPLPCEVFLWPNHRSYTGQPVAEFHTFGSPPLLESLLKTLCSVGARLAQPGEFTLRAFLSGRIDLTQAEAVLGVIDAANPDQLRTALHQLAGGLAAPLHRLRDDLLELLAHLEAGFDFAEEDISFISSEQIERQLALADEQVSHLLERMASRTLSETEVNVVLQGRPNSGKSSLFNALLKRPGALVSSTPGTTRDYLCAELDLDGVKCQLLDTAGVDDSFLRQQHPRDFGEGEIEAAAQATAHEQHRQAALRVLCLDATRLPNEWEIEQLLDEDSTSRLVVMTKIDGCPAHARWTPHAFVASESPKNEDLSITATSSKTGEGIDTLRAELRRTILALHAKQGDFVAGTAARCCESLQLAVESLHHAQLLLEQSVGEELVAGEIRLALEGLGRVVGAVCPDDVLDRIFSRFCVGK